MAESFNFIESGVILNIRVFEDLAKCNFDEDDFSIHGEAYKFIVQYFDEHEKFPELNLIKERYPDIDFNAVESGLDYCVQEFHKQSLTRKATNIIKKESASIIDDPDGAVSNIIGELGNLNFNHKKIFWYENEGQNRFDEYLERKKQRSTGLGIIGIPTILRTLNEGGVGILPGDLYSLWARPEVGKSWFCVKAAANCIHLGYRTLFVSPEMSAMQIALRIDPFLGKLRGYEFSCNALTGGDPIDEEEYAKFLNETANRDLIICDSLESNAMTVVGLGNLLRKYKPEILIIDGMELISAGGRNRYERKYEQITDTYGCLKTLCVATKVAAIVTHQANRSAAQHSFKPPRIDEVSNGDALIRFSDVAMSMCLVEEDAKQRYISFQKSRNKPKPEKKGVRINFDVDRGIFKEFDG